VKERGPESGCKVADASGTLPLGHHRHRLAIRLADDPDHLLFSETLCALLPPNREPVSHVIRGPKSLGQVNAKVGFSVVCMDARAAADAVKSRRVKSDKADAYALAEMLRTGWYRAVYSAFPWGRPARTTCPPLGHPTPTGAAGTPPRPISSPIINCAIYDAWKADRRSLKSLENVPIATRQLCKERVLFRQSSGGKSAALLRWRAGEGLDHCP
jgi:hypothetical protein